MRTSVRYFSFHLCPEKIFPFAALQEQLRKFGVFGLSIASSLLPMLTSDRDSGLDLDDHAERIQSRQANYDPFAAEKNKSKFNKRMREVICGLNRLGYI